MNALKIATPEKSLMRDCFTTIHYSDSFSGEIISRQPIQVTSIARYLLNYNPTWLVWLYKVRNCLVRPLGLQTGEEVEQPVLAIRKGERAGFFDVQEVTDEEVLLYASDKHLSASLSFRLEIQPYKYKVTVTTKVCYHNFWGRVYFFVVKPFHILIIKSMITSITNEFSEK
ncbi:DUF2867 domain-containing protein [uncultured Acetobacteroides sp.]|uniref:DUF2867 domain-containing protein n=1 Tax=uncultured Acetobacteroides sp. TaxID=1760811 RepID=UPI0029F563E1|nr:DUF2867 domain-containing protein [uncultured Acetobacteroides sp.]